MFLKPSEFSTVALVVLTAALVGCSPADVSALQDPAAVNGPVASLSDGGAASLLFSDGGVNVIAVQAALTGPALYVASTGNDANSGTASAPVKTFARAGKLATPGTTVFIRGGVYHATETLSAIGTASQPIVFEPFPNESVKVDGNGLAVAYNRPLVAISASAYVTLQGIEVKNSSGRGLEVSTSDHVSIKGCSLHDFTWGGFMTESDNTLFDGNEVYNTNLDNVNGGTKMGYWSSGIGSWLKADGSWVKGYVFTNNYVHDTWGECVIMLFADSPVVRGNRIRDCWSTNLYLDHVRNALVEKNFVYTTTSTYNKPSVGTPATGIGMAVEPYSTTAAQPLDTLTLRNNLVVGTGLGINFWNDTADTSSSNTYRNIHVESNVVYSQARAAISFDAVSSGASLPYGCTMRNNIFHAGTLNNASMSLGNLSGWSVQSNDFPGGIPSGASGSGNFVAAPSYQNPSLSAGATGWQLNSGSPCKAKGVSSSYVADDYWATPRGSTPSVGIYEPKSAT